MIQNEDPARQGLLIYTHGTIFLLDFGSWLNR